MSAEICFGRSPSRTPQGTFGVLGHNTRHSISNWGQMLVLPGTSSISEPRRRSLLSSVQTTCSKIVSIDAVHLHLVKGLNASAEVELAILDSEPRKTLNRLLDYGDDTTLPGTLDALRAHIHQEDVQAGFVVIYVLPRPGSISPWSSKASDIAHLCNLEHHVERLERGMAFVVQLSSAEEKLTEADLASFSHSIHDRMTQLTLFTLPDETSVFSHEEPRPLRTVELLSGTENLASPSEEELESFAKAAHAKLVEANTVLGYAFLAPSPTHTHHNTPTQSRSRPRGDQLPHLRLRLRHPRYAPQPHRRRTLHVRPG